MMKELTSCDCHSGVSGFITTSTSTYISGPIVYALILLGSFENNEYQLWSCTENLGKRAGVKTHSIAIKSSLNVIALYTMNLWKSRSAFLPIKVLSS